MKYSLKYLSVSLVIIILIVVAIWSGVYVYNNKNTNNSVTSEWKTYRSEKYGFEIGYPTKGSAISEEENKIEGFNDALIVYTTPAPVDFGQKFSVLVKSFGSNVEIQKFAKDFYGKGFISSEYVTINEITWLKVKYIGDYFGKEMGPVYITQNGGNLFIVNKDVSFDLSDDDFVKIVSSFKFIPTRF